MTDYFGATANTTFLTVFTESLLQLLWTSWLQRLRVKARSLRSAWGLELLLLLLHLPVYFEDLGLRIFWHIQHEV